MSTIREIIENGVARSTANDPNVLAAVPELVSRLNLVVQEYYTRAASKNPYFFLTRATVTAGVTGWARPTDAINVVYIDAGPPGADGKVAVGKEVNLVSFQERTDSELPPRIIRVGSLYETVGEALDPVQSSTGDKLQFWYSHEHQLIVSTDIDGVLDTTWPDRHENLLELKIAQYLSAKDKARGDYATVKDELDKAEALFDLDIEQEDSAQKTRFRRLTPYRQPEPTPVN